MTPSTATGVKIAAVRKQNAAVRRRVLAGGSCLRIWKLFTVDGPAEDPNAFPARLLSPAILEQSQLLYFWAESTFFPHQYCQLKPSPFTSSHIPGS